MNTLEQSASAGKPAGKKAGPNPDIVIWDDQWIPEGDKQHWSWLDDPSFQRSPEWANLPDPQEVLATWRKNDEFMQLPARRQNQMVSNLYDAYSKFDTINTNKAFGEAFGDDGEGEPLVWEPNKEEVTDEKIFWTDEEVAEWQAGGKPFFGEKPVQAIAQAARKIVDYIRPEERPWYNPGSEVVEAYSRQREADQEEQAARQAASREDPRAARGQDGSSPLRMRNDMQLTPAGHAVVETGRNLLDRGRQFVGGLSDFFSRVNDQLPVRVQAAQRTIESLQAKIDAGHQLSEQEAQLAAREAAILERYSQGSDVVRTGVDTNTGRPVAQTADGQIGYLK